MLSHKPFSYSSVHQENGYIQLNFHLTFCKDKNSRSRQRFLKFYFEHERRNKSSIHWEKATSSVFPVDCRAIDIRPALTKVLAALITDQVTFNTKILLCANQSDYKAGYSCST